MRNRAIFFWTCSALVAFAAVAGGDTAVESYQSSSKERLLSHLPDSVSDGLEVDAWAWIWDSQNDQPSHSNYWGAEFSLEATKSFHQQAALTVQGNWFDDNTHTRGELEQGFVSVLLSQKDNTFVTFGKFNANFGVEARDFWNRTTGTTSVLFGAQPQDLIGVMLTAPLGDSHLTLRPFISQNFQGQFNFNHCPSAGMTLEYRPNQKVNIAVTGWVGPGFAAPEEQEDEEYAYPGYGSNYYGGGYGNSGGGSDSYEYGYPISENWRGPRFAGSIAGTLVFVEAKATWQARQDLRFSAEVLDGDSKTSDGDTKWYGGLLQADYDLTDRLSFFARTSYLHDVDGVVSGLEQRIGEISGGIAFELYAGLWARVEYRHDQSNASGNSDGVSFHLTYSY